MSKLRLFNSDGSKFGEFTYDETIEGVKLVDDSGSDAVFSGVLLTKVYVSDYGGGFANFTPPAGKEGMIIVAVDTNSTTPGTRLYVYANGSWKYIDLT